MSETVRFSRPGDSWPLSGFRSQTGRKPVVVAKCAAMRRPEIGATNRATDAESSFWRVVSNGRTGSIAAAFDALCAAYPGLFEVVMGDAAFATVVTSETVAIAHVYNSVMYM